MEHKTEHEVAAFEEFWAWKDSHGIGKEEEDWFPWWETFLAGYKYAITTPVASDRPDYPPCGGSVYPRGLN